MYGTVMKKRDKFVHFIHIISHKHSTCNQYWSSTEPDYGRFPNPCSTESPVVWILLLFSTRDIFSLSFFFFTLCKPDITVLFTVYFDQRIQTVSSFSLSILVHTVCGIRLLAHNDLYSNFRLICSASWQNLRCWIRQELILASLDLNWIS